MRSKRFRRDFAVPLKHWLADRLTARALPLTLSSVNQVADQLRFVGISFPVFKRRTDRAQALPKSEVTTIKDCCVSDGKYASIPV